MQLTNSKEKEQQQIERLVDLKIKDYSSYSKAVIQALNFENTKIEKIWEELAYFFHIPIEVIKNSRKKRDLLSATKN